MARTWDAIVIGGGHNGLVCAAYLAKAGRKVLVLEKRPLVGGAAVSEELHPGFTYSVCSYVVSLLRPWIIRELDLARHGLEILPLDCTFNPFPDGRSLARWGDAARTRREVAQFSARDAEMLPQFGRQMVEISRFVKPIIDAPAADPLSRNPADLFGAAAFGRRFVGLGPDMLARKIKMLTMSAVDFLHEWFECEQLIAPMAGSGIIGTFLGIRSPGTAYVLLHHYMGEIDGHFRSWGLARGGTGAISNAIAGAARAAGAEIRTGAGVAELRMHGGEVQGVVLESGEELHARAVVSALDPHRTFFGLAGRENLPDEFAADLGRYKLRGSSGKVNLALDALPDFVSRPGAGPHLMGDITIAPTIDSVERAYDQAKYGEFSHEPFLNIVIPSLTDPSVAPPGKHVMSCFVQYAPYHLAAGAGTWPLRREEFGDAVVDTIARYAPGIKDLILHRQVLTPWDLEKDFGLTEGNIFHGELSLEQLAFLRPVPGWARYKTPLPRLWMCGSGTHPGGGIMGAPGALAARAMLREGRA
ncbi:MAG TPA: NAD(P)/FAD-dependent oxidoreductase [Planctomycetota bacterium]